MVLYIANESTYRCIFIDPTLRIIDVLYARFRRGEVSTMNVDPCVCERERARDVCSCLIYC
jgi:hypothetical protein